MLEKAKDLFHFFTRPKYLLIYALVVFSLLLYKDIFSTRTLIPNLEPYPDTFHYIVPARNLVMGEGFTLARGFGDLKISVPPLYSFSLIPFLSLNPDPRMFYIANFILSLTSLYLFYLILKKLVKEPLVIGFSLLLFSTAYYFYWYPQWAMAENLLLPLFLGGVYLLTLPVNKKRIVIAALLTVSFYGTKYAAAPISLFYALVYLLKIYLEEKKVGGNLLTYIAFTALAFLPLHLYIKSISGADHLGDLIRIVTKIFPAAVESKVLTGTTPAGESEWYSSFHFLKNFPRYLRGTFGGGERFLWDFKPILPRYLSFLGYAGLIWGVLRKKTRLLSLGLLSLLLFQILFASTFYAFDMRYVYIVLPTLLIGIGLFLSFARDTLTKKNLSKLFYVGLIALFSYYLVTNAIRIKDQIVLNLKYSENPWSYVSVLHLNDYFEKEGEGDDEKPLVISAMPPFYIDYYSNKRYDLLPLSPEQEFRRNRDMVWGPGDYSDLPALYEKRLEEGRELYVSTYGLGVEGYLHSAFENLEEGFSLEEVYNECHNLCKLYKVTKDE